MAVDWRQTVSHELKIASHQTSPVLLYSAALASGCLVRTSVTHYTANKGADVSANHRHGYEREDLRERIWQQV